MRYFPTLLLACSIITAHAQPFNWQWSQTPTSTASTPDAQGFATDALGNSYVTGIFYGTATFGTLPSITSFGQSDIYVVKYDNQGTALWVARAGGADFDNPYAVAIKSIFGEALVSGLGTVIAHGTSG